MNLKGLLTSEEYSEIVTKVVDITEREILSKGIALSSFELQVLETKIKNSLFPFYSGYYHHDMPNENTFMYQYLTGSMPIETIDDFIDEWHKGNPDGQKLHEFLGMTEEQYSIWIKTGKIVL